MAVYCHLIRGLNACPLGSIPLRVLFPLLRGGRKELHLLFAMRPSPLWSTISKGLNQKHVRVLMTEV
jgi:hypothetical protein